MTSSASIRRPLRATANNASHHRRARAALLFALLGLLASACGHAPNYYRHAVSQEDACCDHLADPGARDACHGKVRRVDSAALESTPTNQETFECVDKNFVCDKATGGPTKESAQAQLDCLNSLETTQQMSQ